MINAKLDTGHASSMNVSTLRELSCFRWCLRLARRHVTPQLARPLLDSEPPQLSQCLNKLFAQSLRFMTPSKVVLTLSTLTGVQHFQPEEPCRSVTSLHVPVSLLKYGKDGTASGAVASDATLLRKCSSKLFEV